MKKLYILLLLPLLFGCRNIEQDYKLSQIEVNINKQTKLLELQNKLLITLNTKYDTLVKELNSIPKWK